MSARQKKSKARRRKHHVSHQRRVPHAVLSGSLVAAIGLAGPAAPRAEAVDFSASFVKDINLSEIGGRPGHLTSVGSNVFFVADDSAGGRELWKSDGTSGETVRVKDINPGGSSSFPYHLTAVGSTLFFTADDGVGGTELWKSDGTAAGTVQVKDINPGGSSSSPGRLTTVGSTLFFTANNGTNGRELWKSDGTSGGTVQVKDINAGGGSYDGSLPEDLTDVGGTLLFSATDGTSGRELWKSDGTEAGTVQVKDINAGYESGLGYNYYGNQGFANVAGTVFFTADDGTSGRELWKSDGTEAGTVQVKDIRTGSYYGGHPHGSQQGDLTNVNGTLFFTANDGTSGRELWKSDGTEAGTVQVKDIRTGTGFSASSYPSNLTDVGGTLLFSATDGTSGRELWKSDGTSAGTVQVKDINDGAGYSSPRALSDVNGTLFFTAYQDESGIELWKSDGTSAGTVQVKDIHPGSESGFGYSYYGTSFAHVGSTVFFAANNGVNGNELWKSDGSAGGTALVRNIGTGSYGSLPSYTYGPGSSVDVNGTLFFAANDGTHGTELWKSDGTAAGTVLVRDIHPSVYGRPQNLTNVSGTLFFTAGGGNDDLELWKSDGTAAGTVQVRNINPGTYSDGSPRGSYPHELTNVGGTLFFSADGGTDGQELWKSDGTPAGTVQVKDINPGAYYSYGHSSQPANLTVVGGTLFFTANDGTNGTELWKSDGSAAGTVLVKDTISGSGSAFGYYHQAYDANFTNSGGTLFFTANDGTHGTELWKSDGTAVGTVQVKDLFPGTWSYYSTEFPNSSEPRDLVDSNGTLFFGASSTSGRELWKSDGTEVGTVQVKDINPSGSGLGYNYYYGSNAFAATNGTVFFAANDGTNGTELWKSDGTAAGTVQVQDIRDGSKSSYPSSLTAVGDSLLFAARDDSGGRELWESNVATGRVRDIRAGSSGSDPASLVNAGGTVFLAANDGTIGHELWKATIPVSPPTDPPPDDDSGSSPDGGGSPTSGPSPDATQPPSDATPTNSFGLPGKRAQKANTKNGALKLTFKLPGAGTLAAEQAKTGKAQASAKKKRKKNVVLVRRASVTARTAGKVALVLRPTKQAKVKLKSQLRKLVRKGKRAPARLKVPVTFTYTPEGGTPRSRTSNFVLKLKAKKRGTRKGRARR